MPLEGHWQRQHSPVWPGSRRERGVLAAAGGAVVAGAVAIVIATATHGAGAARPGCVDVTVPSTTGGAQMHACGGRARTFCATRATLPADVAEQALRACAAAGLA